MKKKLRIFWLIFGITSILNTPGVAATTTPLVTPATPSNVVTPQSDNTKATKPALIPAANTPTLQIIKGSTLMFNIQKLSDMFGWDIIIEGKGDMEIMRTTSIDLTNYKDSLTALVKNYPVHVDLYEANHVAVINLTQN